MSHLLYRVMSRFRGLKTRITIIAVVLMFGTMASLASVLDTSMAFAGGHN
jgi:hypothetical protein